jgi:DNA topoisomerase I
VPAEKPTRRLVIVESPTKARTIKRFLPGEYQVEASMGHVRDLPASAAEIPEEHKGQSWARLGVKVDNGFEPLYVVSPKKREVVRKLRRALKQADELLIATDEDREGESIGWHLVQVLAPRVPVKRMVFHEITEEAIRRALDETRAIDGKLVDAQETRRVLDRLVGYTISPLLWKKIAPRLSAGRVQSVAVRLLVLREQERLRFRAGRYWDLSASLVTPAAAAFTAQLTHLGAVRVASGRDFDESTGRLRAGLADGRDVVLLDEQRAQALADALRRGTWRVAQVDARDATRQPAPPFTTSTLQQEASRKLGLGARDTMRVAQGLYERGYITYMRTDATHLSEEALLAAREAIHARYGAEYVPGTPRRYTKRGRNAQEAHEAIRPAGTSMPTAQEHGLRGTDAALYELIWKRTVASQMRDARLRFVSARIDATVPGDEADHARFRATGRTIVFPGFFRAYVEGSDDPEASLDAQEQPLPALEPGAGLEARAVEALAHETKPPARYTEASLVKLLEQEGIGRPSTYASIIDTILRRQYARKQGTQLVPSFVAFATNALLEHQFESLVDTEFTATMEAMLDEIANGSVDPVPYLRSFYGGEEGLESTVARGLERIDAREISTIRDPAWDPYVVRVGRYGPYVEGVIDGEVKTASVPDDAVPADLTRSELERFLRDGNTADHVLGSHPESGHAMVLRRGPYGPYLQLGEAVDGARPKRVSLPPGLAPEGVDAGVAQRLLDLPRRLGAHPETGEPIEAHIGRFGPYVRHQGTFASIPKAAAFDVLSVTLEQALDLLARKRGRGEPLRIVGEHPESGQPIELRAGKYGPYVSHGKLNASLKEGQDPQRVSLEEALALLAEREATAEGRTRRRAARAPAERAPKGGRGSSARPRRGGASVAGTARRTPAKGSAAKQPTRPRPKASADDLEPHLAGLEPQAREVVTRLEGMAGRPRQALVAVADSLGLAQEEVERLHKRGMFKLRMAYGKERAQTDAERGREGR